MATSSRPPSSWVAMSGRPPSLYPAAPDGRPFNDPGYDLGGGVAYTRGPQQRRVAPPAGDLAGVAQVELCRHTYAPELPHDPRPRWPAVDLSAGARRGTGSRSRGSSLASPRQRGSIASSPTARTRPAGPARDHRTPPVSRSRAGPPPACPPPGRVRLPSHRRRRAGQPRRRRRSCCAHPQFVGGAPGPGPRAARIPPGDALRPQAARQIATAYRSGRD